MTGPGDPVHPSRHAAGPVQRLMQRVVAFCVTRPRTTLALAGVLVALCALLASAKLEISTDQNKQFSEKVPFFRDYLDFIRKFPENEAIYVIVRAADEQAQPTTDQWAAIADDIASRCRGLTRFVREVDHRVPADALGPQGLVFDSPQRVHAAFEEGKRFVPLARLWGEAPSPATALLGQTPMQRFLGAMALAPADADTARFLTLLADSWTRALQQPTLSLKPGDALPDLARLDASDPSRLGYYYVKDQADPQRHVLLVRIYPLRDFTSMTALADALDAIRAQVAAATSSHPGFLAGVTGRPALEGDELRTTDKDARVSEILALTTVFIGLVLLLRSVWLALVTEIGLGVGIGLTFGWATLSVGELNLLSMVFLLALIGIGVDYLIQVVSRYRHEAAIHTDPRLLWHNVFHRIGPPINITCAGAAGAFLVSAVTDFRGAAELGIIAGGGLFLCLLAGYTVVPAILTLWPARRAIQAEQASLASALPPAATPSSSPVPLWRSLAGPVAWALALLLLSPNIVRSRFDPGLISLQAPDQESVKLVRHLNTWFSVVLSKDLDVLRRSRGAVADASTVASTDSLLDAIDNQAWLAARQPELPRVDWATPATITPDLLPDISRKAEAIAGRFELRTRINGGDPDTQSTLAAAGAALRQAVAAITDADAKAASARLSDWQGGFVSQLRTALASFSPPPLDVKALPPALRDHYVAADGTFALYIYPKADLWDQAALAQFVREVDARIAAVPGAPAPTGIAQDIFHTTAAIERAFYTATGLALALILVLVLIDFRRLVPTLLAFSVLALGLPMLVAIMGLLNVSWNFANFFGLPILIGAGHEYGVFLVHRWKEALREPERGWQGWDVSDRALLLCAFATSSSFGYFWAVGHHQGLRSLGLVMALGVASIYLAAVIVLRPLLRLSLQRRQPPAKKMDA
ncbi:MAG: MMPL family transporter [Tepidisphaera sp.]|nr:MMPL family transporter [Tepidisphaera sp.]